MDLVDRIETTRFVGHEFLLWVWYVTELKEGDLELEDGTLIGLWMDSQLTLEAPNESSERIVFKGVAPSTTPEAREALLQGKLPVKAKLNLTRGAQEFSFVFDAPTFGVAAVKVPATIDDGDSALHDRLGLVEELDLMLGALYREFLAIRLTPLWASRLVPAMRQWAGGSAKGDAPARKQSATEFDDAAYNELLREARSTKL